MSEYQYDCATSKREARKAIYSCFDEDKKLNNSSYFNKIILISDTDANIDLANELYTFFKEKDYRIVQLEEDDDFSKHLLSKHVKDVSNGMCVYIMDELPECELRNAFVLELTY